MNRNRTYRTVSKDCENCGSIFSFQHSIGMKKTVCSDACMTEKRAKNKVIRQAKLPNCSVEGCKTKATRVGCGMCETHFYRLRRTGSTKDPVFKNWTKATNGYIAMMDKNHFLSGRNGMMYQHRFVLFESIGTGEHSCYWCREKIEWKATGKRKLVVDHLDGNKENNSLDNLVASCHRCNASRGLFESWVRKHLDDPFLHKIFEDAKAKGLLVQN